MDESGNIVFQNTKLILEWKYLFSSETSLIFPENFLESIQNLVIAPEFTTTFSPDEGLRISRKLEAGVDQVQIDEIITGYLNDVIESGVGIFAFESIFASILSGKMVLQNGLNDEMLAKFNEVLLLTEASVSDRVMFLFYYFLFLFLFLQY
jgi:hypothetical protein